MKKLFAILLLAALAFTFVGCSKSIDTPAPQPSQPEKLFLRVESVNIDGTVTYSPITLVR